MNRRRAAAILAAMRQGRLFAVALTAVATAALAAPASANTIRAGAYSGVNTAEFVASATVGHDQSGGFVLRSFDTTVRVFCRNVTYRGKVTLGHHIAIPASGYVESRTDHKTHITSFALTFSGDKARGHALFRQSNCQGNTDFTIHRQHHQ